MSRIGYRDPRYYQASQIWPRLDPPKACPTPQAANEPRTGESNEPRSANEQGPTLQTPETPETPDSANPLNPSSKAPPAPRDTQNSETLLTLIDSELFRNGQPNWEGGAEELQRELT